jgi:hypothetical protein
MLKKPRCFKCQTPMVHRKGLALLVCPKCTLAIARIQEECSHCKSELVAVSVPNGNGRRGWQTYCVHCETEQKKALAWEGVK